MLLPLSAVDAFSRTGKPFLYDDTEEVKISAAEKIDAEYLAQALFTDEEETDISYRIAGMVETAFQPASARLTAFGTFCAMLKK